MSDAVEQFLKGNVNHPFTRDNSVLHSRPAVNFVKEMLGWIDVRRPGGLLYGKPRLGKTRAIKLGARAVRNYFPNYISFHVGISDNPSKTLKLLYYQFLRAMRHKYATQGSAAQMEERIINYIIHACPNDEDRGVIFFLDESQNLNTESFGWLVNITNALGEEGVYVHILFCGQPEIRTTFSEIKDEKKEQIVGRFGCSTHKFEGLSDLNDIKIFFRSIDEEIGPEGKTYTEFFCPDGFGKGWRLESQAEKFMDSYKEIFSELALPRTDIPMEFVSKPVQLLFKSTLRGNLKPPYGKESIVTAIKQAGYSNFLAKPFTD